MPFYPPNINPQAQNWKDQANALPEPEGGGHVLSFLANLLAPQLNRAYGRAVEGKYEGQPWQAMAADAFVPDQGVGAGVGEAMGMANPLAAGMVRMGGKTFDNALLHRALGDPAELDWLANLFQKGRSTQKPTSAVTPSVMSTFGSEPYGLLFNADASKGQIAHAGAADMWSKKRPSDEIEATARRYWKTHDILEKRGASDDTMSRFAKAWDNLLKKPPEKWTPSSGEGLENMYGYNPTMSKNNSLRDVFELQAEMAREKPELMPAEHLIHNEIIPNIDSSMLAGVRLPMEDPKYATNLNPHQEWGPGLEDLVRSLKNFAEQQNVPIYRWPAEMTQAQQLKGLQDPFKGNWIQDPKGYMISDQTKRIFGVEPGI